MKIKKNDKVLVIKGKDRGKTGIVADVDPTRRKIRVEGVNIQKRHLKKNSRPGAVGGVTEVMAWMQVCNVMLVCPMTAKPTRVGYQITGDKKFRFSKTAASVIEDVKS
jgi:large subunit ribosomal protein L24